MTADPIYPNLIRLVEADKMIPTKKAKEIAAFIHQHCKPWLKESDGRSLYRGLRSPRSDSPYVGDVRTNRQPKDSSPILHNGIVQAIHDAGLIANRTNSIHTSPDFGIASEYGKVFTVYPIGEFNYTWSPHIDDATPYVIGEAMQMMRSALNGFIDSVKSPTASEVEYWFNEYWSGVGTEIVDAAQARAKCDEEDGGCRDEVMGQYYVEMVQQMLRHLNSGFLSNTTLGREYHTYAPLELMSKVAIAQTLKDAYLGDDGSLKRALMSHHEIMIHCKDVMYVPRDWDGAVQTWLTSL